MTAQPKKTGAEIKSLISRLQPARKTQLRVFRDDDDAAPGSTVKVIHKITTIQPDTRTGAKTWEELHNDPNIVINAEKDYMSHKDGLKTVIRYTIYKREEPPQDPEDMAADLLG